MKLRNNQPVAFAVCINNEDYSVSLELHKIYRVLPDKDVARHGAVRVVDESGEDYLYEAERFVLLEAPAKLRESLLKTPKQELDCNVR